MRFFKNHRFLSLRWAIGLAHRCSGSRQYRDKIIGAFGDRVWTNRAAVKIKREGRKVCIMDSTGKTLIYDKVILACHADERWA